MARYYFSIRNGERFEDVDGLELSDVEAARAEALGLARDLMRLRNDRKDWSGWSIRVTDEQHAFVLELPFADIA
jgi:hypothetical protein